MGEPHDDSDPAVQSRRLCQLLYLDRVDLDHAVQRSRDGIEASREAIRRAVDYLDHIRTGVNDSQG